MSASDTEGGHNEEQLHLWHNNWTDTVTDLVNVEREGNLLHDAMLPC